MMLQTTFADIVIYSLFVICMSAALASYLLYRRLMSGIRTEVRVHMSGGTEKRFEAVEVGREIKWIQDGEDMSAQIPITVDPGHTWRWGIHYRVFNVIDGADEALPSPWLEKEDQNASRFTVTPVPWMQADKHKESLAGDEGAKERYRRRVRAYNSFKQAIAGLSSVNRWQAAALIIMGLFAGLYLAPIITGAIT